MSLHEYRRKRHPDRTPEPWPTDAELDGAPGDEAGGQFVVQEHHARRLHYDLRLERDGVLASWAIPKGLPPDPATNHLAVRTEDHPMAYATFSGEIPAGEYGAGVMTIFDRGRYECTKWTEREVKIVLHGRRLKGGWALFKTDEKNWMIHREREALPSGLLPMMAGGTGLPPSDDGWAYEMKWDGQRVLAYLDGLRARLQSRTGRDITAVYPELAGLGPALSPRRVLLDGEVVVFVGGRPDFGALQHRMNSSPGDAMRLVGEYPATYLIFDVLHLDGRSLLDLPYRERHELLTGLELSGPSWLMPPAFLDASGQAVLNASHQQGLEGIVAKRLSSRYLPGARSPDWRKIKHARHQDVVIGGWRPGKGVREGRIGSLLVGVYTDDGLVYAGRVGSGLDETMLRLLADKLEPLQTKVNPFGPTVPREHFRDAHWVRPELVAEVAYGSWTTDDRLRHPTYRGLRPDIDPAEVRRAG
jgi:bifunctional non-homologous end joining protein LigD